MLLGGYDKPNNKIDYNFADQKWQCVLKLEMQTHYRHKRYESYLNQWVRLVPDLNRHACFFEELMKKLYMRLMGKYIKGLNKDTAPVDQPEGSYRYAKNMLSNETAGALSNEPGNIVLTAIATGHRVIGSIEVTDDTVVLFTILNDIYMSILLVQIL